MKDRTVLITGSSKGLGKELSLVFGSNGYDVILHGRNRKDLIIVKKEILKRGVSCFIVRGDLRSDSVIKRLFEIAKRKDISVLINNAAAECPHLALEKIGKQELEDILMTNLIAPIKLTKRIYSLFLRKKAGAIININSISGLENQRLRSIYCASKWGLRGFTDTLRLEARGHNVRVIGVYPSRIKTRPHFTYGMSAQEAAQRIFDAYKNNDIKELILDERPVKLKIS
jgi:short-subunit dehydrogenase